MYYIEMHSGIVLCITGQAINSQVNEGGGGGEWTRVQSQILKK